MAEEQNQPKTDQPAAPGPPPAAPKEEDSLEGPAAASQPTPPQPASAQPKDQPPKKTAAGKTFIFGNLYLIIFAILVVAGGIVLYVSVKTGAPPKNNKASSLTDKQLATLKGNTTLVGDTNSTLDVQSNSIFEGQVLLKSDLNVAGGLQVGKGLSLPSIAVGGSGTFGQVGISGGLNVSKDTVIQGKLTVKNNLAVSGTASFGGLDVSTLSVTNLSIRSDLTFDQHLVSSGGVPSRTGGTALGGGGTVSLSGTDTAGSININTGSGAPAGCFVSISFTHAFGSIPYVVISPDNSSAAAIQYYVDNRSTGGFSLCTANVPGNGKNFVYNYLVVQ